MQDVLFSFGLIIIAGALFRRIRPAGIDPGDVRVVINACVLNLFLPALCIKTLYQSPVDLETVLVPATAWITTGGSLLLAAGIYAALGGIMHLSPQEKGVLLIAAAFGNVTYLGLPVLTSLYGSTAAKYALFYDLLATTPLLWLAGAALASRYGEGKKVDLKESGKTIASLPPVWGIFIGMALHQMNAPLPLFVLKTLDMLGSLVVPLMIFSIGLALSLPKVKHAYAIIPAVVIKLIAGPVIAYGTARMLGLTGVALTSCSIEGAMPAMVLSLLVAARFRLDVSLAAFVIVVTTVLSFFTLPAVIYLGSHVP
jgi:predicted permease